MLIKDHSMALWHSGMFMTDGLLIPGHQNQGRSIKAARRELLAAEQEMRHMEVEPQPKTKKASQAPKQKLDAMME